jgi:hypothetical protein
MEKVITYYVIGYFGKGFKVLAVASDFETAHDKRDAAVATGRYEEVLVGGENAYFSFPCASE